MNIPGYFPKQLIPPEPRHVVSTRRLVKTPPGSAPITLEPTLLGAYWAYPVARDHAALVCDDFRAKGFTITEIQCEGPVKWEANKLDSVGNWITFEIYITTISF